MSNLTQRLLSAAVLLPPVIAAFIFGGWWLRSLILLAAVVCFWEYGEVVAKERMRERVVLLVAGTAATALCLVLDDGLQAIVVLQLTIIALACAVVLQPGDLATSWVRLSVLAFGVLWVGLGFMSIGRLRDMGEAFDGVARGGFILVAFTATWANDTCAYFAGRAFGKHKMAEVISPKKTWEGFAGGAVGTLVFLVCGRLLFPNVFQAMTYVDMVLVSIPAAFLGPMGDLAESMWKRGFSVKDSGKILPGHGGILDRVDAVFFVAPWTLTYFLVCKPVVDKLLQQYAP